MRALQEVELASGLAFFGLVTWGIVDAIVGYRPRVELSPMIGSGAAGVGMSWTP